MKSNTEAALAFVYKDEGGYAERPTEGGGSVNMGITFTVFSAWRQLAGKPAPTWADLKAMTVDEATQIYEAQFLTGVHFDDLPAGADYCVLDAAINGGVAGSIKLLQAVLGFAVADGHYGLVTRWAVQHRPVAKLIDDLCDARLAHYKTFSRFNQPYAAGKTKTWGDIWTERIAEVRIRAHGMTPIPVEALPPIPVAAGATVPKPPGKMPASTEISRGMIKRGFTRETFAIYLRDEVTLKMSAWRPRGVVLHNTGTMQWPGMAHGQPISPEQRLDNMSVDWQNRGFSGGPHLVISPDGIIWAAWPLWKPGTHSPSWNHTFWGIEMVGDFDIEPFPEALKASATAALADLYSMLGHEPTNDTFHLHKEDPASSHKHCPGVNCGDKPTWIARINAAMIATNPGELAA